MTKNFLYLFCLVGLLACRPNIIIDPQALPEKRNGLYILCEGNMGSNKATIDYYDYARDTLFRNIYPTMNPNVVMQLGDVGNDIQLYGSKLYAIINLSNKIEVMDCQARRIAQIDIPNCRYIIFHEGYAYVSSYAGPVIIDPEYKQLGYVLRIDTASLQVLDTCLVGFQPEQMAIYNDKLYVANSGGYMTPNYDSTLSVIPLNTFKEEKRITIGINSLAVCSDGHGGLYVQSRGDYGSAPEQLYYVDLQTEQATPLGFAASHMQRIGDDIFFASASMFNTGSKQPITWGVINTRTHEHTIIEQPNFPLFSNFYGFYIDPQTRHIFLCDAGNYTTPGKLYHFDNKSNLVNESRTGDIPAHFCRIK